MSGSLPPRQARWALAAQPDPGLVAALAAELSLPVELCRLLVIRGHVSGSGASEFLRPRFERTHDPLALRGVLEGGERIVRAIANRELIMVHGDYDVDGICSTALFTRVLRRFGAQVKPFIPQRVSDGYDLGSAGVAAAVAMGASLVLTCDCGTSATAAVTELTRRGIDVIITDHHLPPAHGVPECAAVINPRQLGCSYPDKDLAGVGVAFKFLQHLARRLGADERVVHAHLDLVALATVADVAPLRGENRILVRSGLKVLSESRLPGVRALVRAAGLTDKQITAGRAGFILAPRLNAVGRLGHALRGVELLLSESEHESNSIARELEELNGRRQEIDRATLAEALTLLADIPEECCTGIVLASDNWHPGVIGIVASRIVEETGRPAVLISTADGIGKGSGRSIPSFDLHAGLSDCSDLFVRFGGHRQAAGITISTDAIPAFAQRFNDVVRAKVPPDGFVREIRIDTDIELESADLGTIERLQRHFEPFGPSNAAPVFLARSVEVVRSPRKIGEKGIRFAVRSGRGELEMISWELLGRRGELSPGSKLDMVFRIERDEWKGADRPQGRVLDFRATAP